MGSVIASRWRHWGNWDLPNMTRLHEPYWIDETPEHRICGLCRARWVRLPEESWEQAEERILADDRFYSG